MKLNQPVMGLKEQNGISVESLCNESNSLLEYWYYFRCMDSELAKDVSNGVRRWIIQQVILSQGC